MPLPQRTVVPPPISIWTGSTLETTDLFGSFTKSTSSKPRQPGCLEPSPLSRQALRRMVSSSAILMVLGGIFSACAVYCTTASLIFGPNDIIFKIANVAAGALLCSNTVAAIVSVVIGCQSSGQIQHLTVLSGPAAAAFDVALLLALASSSFCLATGNILGTKTALIWPASVWFGYGPWLQSNVASSMSAVIWHKAFVILRLVLTRLTSGAFADLEELLADWRWDFFGTMAIGDPLEEAEGQPPRYFEQGVEFSTLITPTHNDFQPPTQPPELHKPKLCYV